MPSGLTTVVIACPATNAGFPGSPGLSERKAAPVAAVGVMVCMFGRISPASADRVTAVAQSAARRPDDATVLELANMDYLPRPHGDDERLGPGIFETDTSRRTLRNTT